MNFVPNVNDPNYVDPKYNEVREDIRKWVLGEETGEKQLTLIKLKMLIFFPSEVDFNNAFGLISNFIMKVLV